MNFKDNCNGEDALHGDFTTSNTTHMIDKPKVIAPATAPTRTEVISETENNRPAAITEPIPPKGSKILGRHIYVRLERVANCNYNVKLYKQKTKVKNADVWQKSLKKNRFLLLLNKISFE